MGTRKIAYAPSQRALDNSIREWRDTLGKTTVNHAVSIEEGPGWATVTNENGVVMHFEVRPPADKLAR